MERRRRRRRKKWEDLVKNLVRKIMVLRKEAIDWITLAVVKKQKKKKRQKRLREMMRTMG